MQAEVTSMDGAITCLRCDGSRSDVMTTIACKYWRNLGAAVAVLIAQLWAAQVQAALLRQRHHIRGDAPSDFKIEDPADVLTTRSAAVRILNMLLIAVASVSLIVGGISIMNIMLVSVTERTREIGLRIAVGATRGDIRWQFLIEAMILALVGGSWVLCSGAAAAVEIAWKAGWPILISPWAILLACGFAALVGIAFGLYPARRAARARPDCGITLRIADC
jgi:putative ABC transport system permease protein